VFFMYIHTHSPENCMIDKPQEAQKMATQMGEEAQKANIKFTIYAAPHEHTFYSIVESNDIAALEKVLAPMTKWGDATLIPITPMQQAAK
jgi:hypothetical protein